VRWPPACEDVSPGAQERPWLIQFRVGGKGERHPLEAATKQRLLKNENTLCVL
jgi:hypothetical protein